MILGPPAAQPRLARARLMNRMARMNRPTTRFMTRCITRTGPRRRSHGSAGLSGAIAASVQLLAAKNGLDLADADHHPEWHRAVLRASRRRTAAAAAARFHRLWRRFPPSLRPR